MKVAISAIRTKNIRINRSELIERLQIEGHKVYYIGQESKDEIHTDYNVYNVKFLAIPLKRVNTNPIYEIYSVIQTAKVLKENQIDCLIVYGIRTFPTMVLAARLAGLKNILCIVNGSGRLFKLKGTKGKIIKSISYPMLWISLRIANHVFFQNSDDMKLVHDKKLLSRKNFSTINGSGVNIDVYKSKSICSQPVFTMISRLTSDKGVREYIESARIVKEKFPKASFYLIGPLDDTTIDTTFLQNAMEEGIISLKGKVEDVKPFIEDTRVFVLPSYYPEGVPRSILEAMAMGRPIITTDTPGCRETVVHGVNGYLVKPRDVIDLSEKMISMIMDKKLTNKMGIESRRICEEKFDVHKVNETMLKRINLIKQNL